MAPLLPLCLVLLIQSACSDTDKTKRQIFREQVLPHQGGKIPEDAFRADRLALNRLNKDGISVPDGVVLDARRHHKHPSPLNSDLERSIVKVLITPENRYTPPEGTYHPREPITVDSTYIIRPPIGSYKRPPTTVGRPLPGPPLQIPAAQPPPQRYPVKFTKPPQTVYLGFSDNGNTVNSYLLPGSNRNNNNNNGFLSDSFNTVYNSQAFPDFDTLLAHLNERAARETAAALAASPSVLKPWPSKLPGVEGLDFPALTAIPQTSFQCGVARGQGHRMFADPDTKCQVFHICQKDGRRDSFLCPKGTLFNEALSHCDWWYNVTCRR
ncbi:uncharacterized protein [Anabrus simplex]|uniref:uncharacterized protein isoform X2 n=1 Tax=Anabrus simplex TaxID=316456 RepID=UPI0034DD3DAC